MNELKELNIYFRIVSGQSLVLFHGLVADGQWPVRLLVFH